MTSRLSSLVVRLWTSRGTYVVAGSVGLFVHMAAARPLYSPVDRLLAAVLLWIALGVVLGYARGLGQTSPMLPLVSTQFYIMYGLPQLSIEAMGTMWGPYTPPAAAVSLAMLLAALSSMLCVVAHNVAASRLTSYSVRLGSFFPVVHAGWRLPVLWYAAMSVGMSLWRIANPDAIPVEVRNIVVKTLNPLLALVCLLYLGFRHRDAVCRYAGMAIVAVTALLGFLDSALVAVIVPMYLLFMAEWIWGGKLRTKWIIGAVCLFVLFNPVKHEYRDKVRDLEGVRSYADVAQRVGLWAEAFAETWGAGTSRQENIQTAASRTSALLEFGQVIAWTPDVVPYQHGRGFSTALLFWVPRVVWPGKPGISDLVNNRYAIAFQITTEEGIRRSTFGMRQPADGYWDFGVVGSLAYAVLFGALLGALFRRSRNESFQMISLVFSAEFFQTLANLQYIVASVFTLMVGSYIALKAMALFARRRRPRTVVRNVRPKAQASVS